MKIFITYALIALSIGAFLFWVWMMVGHRVKEFVAVLRARRIYRRQKRNS